jgi:lauroyl/myristoyl acyltransferase
MLDDAAAELAKRNDPEYVASQARARLHFIFPGERQYIIVGNGEITEGHTRQLEKNIREQPFNWLWSHRRWKHKRIC